MNQAIRLNAIGVFHGNGNNKATVARQGVLCGSGEGVVELSPGMQYEMALRDLDGFERIWLLFWFDRNLHWRPTTRPPVPPEGHERVGLFASRAPYRPNPIGMSAVRLLSVQGLRLQVAEADLLEGTPVLDIKPYIPEFDAFPQARYGWLEHRSCQEWTVSSSPDFMRQFEFLKTRMPWNLLEYACTQLRWNPLDSRHKRVSSQDGLNGVLAFRTWRMAFLLNQEEHCIQ
ncbi:MAG TPA: tRNA (N6-threonylcarbamoyladenosine(37)-N6)-methyltransferase TrmO, partial [Fibrobacteraceae bacterium]|nr:tRNA (N6-threonylcarbamoyladenosine(37)-N6)-methyltransferase TrmO [Fibrobacteraceae bacterium]